MTNDDYRHLADLLNADKFVEALLLLRKQEVFSGSWQGKVVSKERPRKGKNGHMFTPTKTRNFENAIIDWLDKEYLGQPVYFPVGVSLRITDPCIPADRGGKWDDFSKWIGLTSKQHGDIDNKAKAVLDAANGILYKDDKQINRLDIQRLYSKTEGVHLIVYRRGLSANELEQLRKFLK